MLDVLDKAYGTNSFEDYEPKTDEDSLTSTQFLQKIHSIESESQVFTIVYRALKSLYYFILLDESE